jgi:glycosyltransferase-like protein
LAPKARRFGIWRRVRSPARPLPLGSRVSERLRIALFTYSTQPRGGVVHAQSVAEALHDLGHDVVLFALGDGGAGFTRLPRCPFVVIPVERRAEPTVAFVRRRVAAYLEALESTPLGSAFDVYHAQDGISGNALATLAARGAIEGYARTIHHIDDFADPELAALQERAIVSARACFAVSEVWRARLRERYGIDAGLVPNGVDAGRFVPANDAKQFELLRSLGIHDLSDRRESSEFYLSIGGIEARKNTLATLEAFALVRQQEPAARLVIAGGASVFDHSSYRVAFEARAAELRLKIGTDVIVTGVLSDELVVAYLQTATALVFPSLVEGFGLVVLEALACGTPVVTSNIPPFTEFLTGDSAFLADPHDPAALANAMLAVREPAARRRLAEHGRPLAARYTWEASAHAHLAGYRAYLQNGATALA